jgi:hypothetical protein
MPLVAPLAASSAQIHFYTTGHALVGDRNCDEFCPRANVLTIDDIALYDEAPWIDCGSACTRVYLPVGQTITCSGRSFNYRCQQNPTSCPSSPEFDRSNWCPGWQVVRRDLAVPPSFLRGSHTVGFAIPGAIGWFQTGAAIVFYR